MKKKPISEIEIQISHPFSLGEYIPLETWIDWGPGPRWGVAPIAARDKSTRKQVPLSAIPFKYRNTVLSRLLFKWGYIEKPWPERSGSNDDLDAGEGGVPREGS